MKSHYTRQLQYVKPSLYYNLQPKHIDQLSNLLLYNIAANNLLYNATFNRMTALLNYGFAYISYPPRVLSLFRWRRWPISRLVWRPRHRATRVARRQAPRLSLTAAAAIEGRSGLGTNGSVGRRAGESSSAAPKHYTGSIMLRMWIRFWELSRPGVSRIQTSEGCSPRK